ncbi:MAG: serpin family protein [Phycisphaerae bacterium]|nr:serpin family protein [Gemmatimonadaceae bacterium]
MKNQVTIVSRARFARRGLSLAAMAGLIACSAATAPKEAVPDDGDGPPPAITALPRALTATETKVRDAANDFSFALLATVTDSQKTANTFISPLSASFALGMTMNGAAAQTFDEMQHALQLRGLSQQEINAGYKSLIDLLLSLDSSVQMRVASSIWYRNSVTFHQTFFDTTKKYFNAEVKGLNFADAPAALGTINAWVASATNDKIKKVLDVIRQEDVMFLINAIYFKGSWRDKFEVSRTANGAFNPATGGAQTVPFMNRTGSMSYTETASYQAVDLPYGNSAFSMTVILPRAGQDVNAVAKGLSSSSWQTLSAALRTGTVNLALPKLKLEYERVLTDDLKALGMKVPFVDRRADFSKMTPDPAFISFVKQNSFVDINEEGTEAAAVTTVGVGVTSAPLTVTMRVDRPYIFVIRERLSGTVLFVGKILRIPD